MNLYCIFLVISQTTAKIVTNEGFDVFDLAFLRTLCNWVIAIGTNAVMRQNPCSFEWEHVGPLVTRSFTGLVCYSCILFGVQLLPIFLANIMLNTGPFWAALLAFCVLGEMIHLIDIICMVGCFIGVVVLATSPAPKGGSFGANVTKNHTLKPVHVAPVAHMMKNHTNMTKEPFIKTSEGKYVVGIICMLTAAWTQAISGLCTRKVKELNYAVFLFAYGMFASAICFVFLFIEYCIKDWGKTPRLFTYNKK
jgi:drug/metabolite transporter (DMT)-like permease